MRKIKPIRKMKPTTKVKYRLLFSIPVMIFMIGTNAVLIINAENINSPYQALPYGIAILVFSIALEVTLKEISFRVRLGQDEYIETDHLEDNSGIMQDLHSATDKHSLTVDQSSQYHEPQRLT